MPEDQHGEQYDDAFEGRLAAALRATGGGFDTDRTALADAGRARGRRLRLRRRAAVLGGVAGIAAVGVGGALFVAPGDAPGSRLPAAAHSAAPAASASPGPAAREYTGDEILRALKELLPEGEFSQEEARGTEDELPPSARLVYDDGKGAAAIGLSLGRVEPGSQEARQVTRCPDEVFVPHDSCTTSRLPDGSVLMLFQGYEYPDRRVDTRWWAAELVTPEGRHVSLSEWNAPAEKDAAVSRPEPPLSPEQLKEVVTAGVWRAVVDAVPEPPMPSATPSAPPRASGESVGETLAGLLPEDVEVVGKGGQEGDYAYVVVDDGEGRSLVQINVQHGMADVADQLYGSGETLPDGTRVATRKGNGDDRVAGVVMWTVDTLRPGDDGFRVVISAFNNGAAHAEPTRDTPALTMEELRGIALSPEWDTMR
ncbi:hypothetical protein [Streptomyces griseomycini]|uniref:LigA protein n=1 Tax=Streptomyces griseomycini TaxID=66895 RepID=A0A7W7PNB5_9ACTN|nr:hypothetical protein [Streptomyces griseomycini]MBB4897261.1 hypothetical protein [Streptomyces griseomycini]GGP92750.1 hypothetical protein GCM10010266_14380 [Streptomyces griseomycini]GGR33586.1 hypothetical protein GCM10015536_43930 [Streptomyces griseomycini]